MTKSTSIYNFVPLNKEVYVPAWSAQVSQDIPFSDGEDGVIELTFHNVSPMFIRNGSSDSRNPSPYSAHVEADGRKLYFIPGSSLKGMIRSTMEIMTFAKMSRNLYTNRYFGFRDFGGNRTALGKIYAAKARNSRPAWLRKENERLVLTPCDMNGEKELKKIPDSEIGSRYPSFTKGKTGWQRNELIHDDCGNWYPETWLDGEKYRLVCTGQMNGKKKEYLFPTGRLDEVEIKDKKVTEAFYTVHEPSPDFQKIMDFLDEGNELAVFYIPGRDEYDVRVIGLSKYMRYPHRFSIEGLVTKQQEYTDEPDLPETIFGYISPEGGKSLKGRVQIGNAFADKALDDSELCEEVSGVLGQPKSSFYPFYLRQYAGSGKYRTYEDADGIAGRKMYRVHRDGTVTGLPQGNGDRNVMTSFRPLPAGMTFHLRIAVHNLRKIETGALLSALTLHNTKGVWHNIGLARGFGYGKLALDEVRLSDGFQYEETEYLHAFEKEMTLFSMSCLPEKAPYLRTPQITTLMGILCEHDDADLNVMTLKEYGEAKKSFNVLTERGVQTKSTLTDQDRTELLKESLKNIYAADYRDAESLRQEGKLSEAAEKYNQIAQNLKRQSVDASEEEKMAVDLRNAFKEAEEARAREAEQEAQEERDRKLSAGLAANLDETYPDGTPRAGQYKVQEYNTFNKKTEQWKKKAKEEALTDTEKEAYAATFRRLYAEGCHPKKEDRDLRNPDSNLWRKAKAMLGDSFETLLGDLHA